MAMDVSELWGREFEMVKDGLSEDQVVSYVNELTSENEMLTQRQQRVPALTRLAEKTVTEAEKLAEEIKKEATDEAKAETAKIVAEAEAQADKKAAAKRNEIVTIAAKEAENIKTNAEREAELIVERRRQSIEPELKSMLQVVHDQLLSDLKSLNQQVAPMGEEFERKLTQLAEQTGIPTEDPVSVPREDNLTHGSGSETDDGSLSGSTDQR